MSQPSSFASLAEDDSVVAPSAATSAASLSTTMRSDSNAGTAFGKPQDVDPIVAEREQKAVFWSRVIMISVLVVAVAAMSTTMFLLIAKNERSTFETQFYNFASELSTVMEENAENTLDAVESFGATITNIAEATNSTWPFVTVPNYPSLAGRLAKLTKANLVVLCNVLDDTVSEREAWEDYVQDQLPTVYKEAIDYEKLDFTVDELIERTSPNIYQVSYNFTTGRLDVHPENKTQGGDWMVYWQSYTLMVNGLIYTNWNAAGGRTNRKAIRATMSTHLPYVEVTRIPNPSNPEDYGVGSQILQPVFDTIKNGDDEDDERKMVGMVWLNIEWSAYFQNILPPDAHGVLVVIESTCNPDQIHSFLIDGLAAKRTGEGDVHDTKYDDLEVLVPLLRIGENVDETTIREGGCLPELTLRIYPTQTLEDSFYTNERLYYTAGVIIMFVFTTLVFGLFDLTVRRRQAKVMARVIRQDRIVSNIFPTAIRDRLYETAAAHGKNPGDGPFVGMLGNPDGFGDAPLAELYPSVTVIFADISGFTAWSSAREPPQVFQLLECIYSAFDKIAYRHGVFKVETVGDCYVAVGGLPDPREDHAVQVAKFARDCLHRMSELTHKLEVSLGPDTSDLGLRLGMHSGQVTAGVLRGERSRFQLFGDTVNTAARMESTSFAKQIQVSSTTAEELQKWKRGRWIRPRDGTVSVKGKGDMQTYWLETKEEAKKRFKSGTSSRNQIPREPKVEMAPLAEESETDVDEEEFEDDFSDDGGRGNMTKQERLVEWNVEVLKKLLQHILAARNDDPTHYSTKEHLAKVETELLGGVGTGSSESNVLDEFKEIITMPIVGNEDLRKRKDPDSIELSSTVISQLRDFLSVVATMYRDNPFHNFEHAVHVTASVRKLLTRIVNAQQDDNNDALGGSDHGGELVDIAGHSYGITSDPLTQFSVIFSAVIHDADHPGCPNAMLVKEGTRLAAIYKKSIAEQNSVYLVWQLLMSPIYADLRACIYCNEEELRQFRQLVVNTVMATDIVDKELQALRKARWAAAFAETRVDSTPELDMNRKATIVIEHLIQASDVSHTMQHWHIYKQWNERFFFELYGLYEAGRADTNPAEGWYKGEIGFFDYYVIPLAKKLEDCGVFGVSSHEYLAYAKANREEWVREGEKIVQEYIEKCNAAGSDDEA